MTLTGATGTVQAADVAPELARWLPDIRDSAEISGRTIIAGKLVDRAERPIGGRVVVVAWPRQSTLEAIGDGESVRLLPVAKAVVGGTGEFVIRLDDRAPIAQMQESDGTVNLDIYSTTSDGLSAFSFPIRLGEGTSAPSVTLGAHPLHLLDGAIPAPVPLDKNYCEAVVRATYDSRLVLVGEVYTGPNAKGDFQYINGSSSTLGVGVSATGAFGSSWSASGTVSRSSTVTIDYPTQLQNAKKVFQTTYQYRKYENRCIGADGGWETISYQTRASAFQGGTASYNAASAPTASACQNQLAGVTVTKQSAAAQTFSNGAKLGTAIGIDLSAKTGFNAETKIKFTFVTAGKLCGTGGLDYIQAPRVVAL